MGPQGPLVDRCVRPGASDQLILADGLAGALNERDENVQSSAAEAQRFPVLEQNALGGDQAERSEGEGSFIHRGIVLKGLSIHTDRERFCNAIASYSDVLPKSRCSQKAAELCTISQSLTRPADTAAPNCKL